MLFPQPIPSTNIVHCMTGILNVWDKDGILILPLLGCGYGCVDPKVCAEQINLALEEYLNNESCNFYLNENYQEIIDEQFNYYENTEFKDIRPENIIFRN